MVLYLDPDPSPYRYKKGVLDFETHSFKDLVEFAEENEIHNLTCDCNFATYLVENFNVTLKYLEMQFA